MKHCIEITTPCVYCAMDVERARRLLPEFGGEEEWDFTEGKGSFLFPDQEAARLWVELLAHLVAGRSSTRGGSLSVEAARRMLGLSPGA